MSTFHAPKIGQSGEWQIGWRDNMIGDSGWSLWWGHESTDEEMGCGNLALGDDGFVFDYDGFGCPTPDVWIAVIDAGFGIADDMIDYVSDKLQSHPDYLDDLNQMKGMEK